MVVYQYFTPRRLFDFNGWTNVIIPLLCLITWIISLYIPDQPFHTMPTMTIFGTALSILVGFRINEAYNRWWEARTLWGQLVNQSRNFTRMVLELIQPNNVKANTLPEIKKRMIYRQIGYVNALRLHLRGQENWQENLGEFIDQNELNEILEKRNKPVHIIRNQSADINNTLNLKPGEDFKQLKLEEILNEMYNIQGGCERIKNTVFPRIYSLITKTFTWLFAIVLILTTYDDFNFQVLVIRGIVAYVFVSLDRIQELLKNPFGNSIADTPMTALSRTIEIDLKEMLGEKNLPDPVKPINGILY